MDSEKRLTDPNANLPFHEGKTFAKALVEHLINKAAEVPERCKNCKEWDR